MSAAVAHARAAVHRVEAALRNEAHDPSADPELREALRYLRSMERCPAERRRVLGRLRATRVAALGHAFRSAAATSRGARVGGVR